MLRRPGQTKSALDHQPWTKSCSPCKQGFLRNSKEQHLHELSGCGFCRNSRGSTHFLAMFSHVACQVEERKRCPSQEKQQHISHATWLEVTPTVALSQHPLSKLTCPADKLHKKTSNQDHHDDSHRDVPKLPTDAVPVTSDAADPRKKPAGVHDRMRSTLAGSQPHLRDSAGTCSVDLPCRQGWRRA